LPVSQGYGLAALLKDARGEKCPGADWLAFTDDANGVASSQKDVVLFN
jgi:hypothetical protein